MSPYHANKQLTVTCNDCVLYSLSQVSSQPQLRQRKPKVVKAVEELDAFPKIPETCIDKTSYGGTASISALIIIVWLVILEFTYFWDPGVKFHFSPDTDLDTKLTINVDITVAMPCASKCLFCSTINFCN